jgi:hypothetical protein
MRRAVLLAVAVLVLCAAGLGCAKRVPWEGPLEARRTMVLVFDDASEIRGKINIDEKVELSTGGGVYRGVIEDLNDEEIELRDCRFLRRRGGNQAEEERMSQARVDLGIEKIDSIVLERAHVVSTEHVKVDALKTASRSVFWVLAGMVSALLLAEKS